MSLGKFKILLVSLPLAALVVLAKVGVHALKWEPFSTTMMPVFTALVTGIIFLLGFILAGVMTDYKESEKIPGEMTASVYAIWQEMEIAARGPAREKALALMRKLPAFIEAFRVDMLIRGNDNKALDMLDSFCDDIHDLDKDVSPAFMGRVRNEQVNLRKHLTRIMVIRDTDFASSVSLLVKGIVAFFIISMLLLKFEPEYVGMFFCFFYSFILVSILRVIGDMDNPFEYEEGVKPVDEIDFFPLFNLEEDLKYRLGKSLSATPAL